MARPSNAVLSLESTRAGNGLSRRGPANRKGAGGGSPIDKDRALPLLIQRHEASPRTPLKGGACRAQERARLGQRLWVMKTACAMRAYVSYLLQCV